MRAAEAGSSPTGDLQARLGHEFSDRGLLAQALTHRSHGQPHNERLEFLGDAILEAVISTILYRGYPQVDEGELSRVRANLVRQETLHDIARRLALGPALRLGEGELRSGGARRPSILANAVEALIGAVHLDGGFAAAERVIRRLYQPILEHVDLRVLGKDAKTLLQEQLQGRHMPLPSYAVLATHGAAHSQVFEVSCSIARAGIEVRGSGRSRRAAEQEAARRALDALGAQQGKAPGRPVGGSGEAGGDDAGEGGVAGVAGVDSCFRRNDGSDEGDGARAG